MLVVDLEDLNLQDVAPFVREWFTNHPTRAQALLTQITNRPDLGRAVEVPLLLTFLCLITEQLQDPVEPLPARRRDLYDRLIGDLIRGAWANNPPGPHTKPHQKACI